MAPCGSSCTTRPSRFDAETVRGPLPFADGTALRDAPSELSQLATTHGHVLLRALLPSHAVAPVRRAALRHVHALGLLAADDAPTLEPGAHLTGTGYDDPRWVTLQQHMGAEESFRDLAEHPALVAAVEALQGEPTTPHRGDVCRLGMPGATKLATPPHQDHHYVGGSTDIWTAWIPLMPCPQDLGPLAVWAGSHRSGYRPHHGEGAGRQQVEVPPETPWTSGTVDVGDVVLFHCFTVHRALPNTTRDTVRLSVDLRYQPASQPLDTLRVDGTRPY